MVNQQDILSLEVEIVNTLKTVYDPEIPVNIYDLGLIYDIETDDQNKVRITMTYGAQLSGGRQPSLEIR
jgi:metal-sulfur cluster biosynthetic enzyme